LQVNQPDDADHEKPAGHRLDDHPLRRARFEKELAGTDLFCRVRADAHKADDGKEDEKALDEALQRRELFRRKHKGERHHDSG